MLAPAVGQEIADARAQTVDIDPLRIDRLDREPSASRVLTHWRGRVPLGLGG
jgi:hypothetical protein